MRTWTRPHPLPPGRVVALIYTALFAFVLSGVLAALLSTGTTLLIPLALLAVAATMALMLSCRAMLVGLFVSTQGVRIRTLTRTVTWRWTDLADFRAGPGQSTLAPRETLWLIPTNGPETAAPLCRGSRGVILTDFGLDALPDATFDATLHRLQALQHQHSPETEALLRL